MKVVMLFRVKNGSRITLKFDVLEIRAGEAEDPILQDDDLVVINRISIRLALGDSLFRDIPNTINPVNDIYPAGRVTA